MQKKRLLLIAAVLSTFTFVTSCANPGQTTNGVPLVEKGKFTMCASVDYEPYEFTRNGKFQGFDIDFGKEIAKDLGVGLEVINIGFESIESGVSVNAKQCDAVISGMTITPERASIMELSDPYLDDNLALVSAETTIKNINDLEKKKLGVQTGTTGEEYALEHAKGAEIQHFESTGEMLNAIQSGRLDAAIGNTNVLGWTTKETPNIKIVEEFDTGEQLGAGIQKENTKMLDSINSTLKRIKEDGTYEKMKEEWT